LTLSAPTHFAAVDPSRTLLFVSFDY